MNLPERRQRYSKKDILRINELEQMSQAEILALLISALKEALNQLPDDRYRHPFIRLVEVRMRKSRLPELLALYDFEQRKSFPEIADVINDHDLNILRKDERTLNALQEIAEELNLLT